MVIEGIKMKQPKCRDKEVKLKEEDMQGMADCMKQFVPEMKLDDLEESKDAKKPSKAIPKDKLPVSPLLYFLIFMCKKII